MMQNYSKTVLLTILVLCAAANCNEHNEHHHKHEESLHEDGYPNHGHPHPHPHPVHGRHPLTKRNFNDSYPLYVGSILREVLEKITGSGYFQRDTVGNSGGNFSFDPIHFSKRPSTTPNPDVKLELEIESKSVKPPATREEKKIGSD